MKTPLKYFLLPALVAALGLMLTSRVTAQTFTPLYSLNGVSDGSGPGALILSGNMFYGTTSSGGISGAGTVFKVGTNGLNYTLIYTFTNGSDGENPSSLVLSGSTLYGVAGRGSTLWGTLFAVNTDGSGFTNIYNFTGGSDGSRPSGLIMVSNILFGTASQGGSAFFGTLFEVNTNGSGFTPLHPFSGQNNGDGSSPIGGLLLVSNILYGATSDGGIGNDGTLFMINADGLGYTNFYNFQGVNKYGVNSDGAYPSGGLILAGNTLYGTAGGGSAGDGTLFAVNTDGSGYTNLFTFTDYFLTPDFETVYTGYSPNGGLVLLGDTLYGTTRSGGTVLDANGAIFSITTNGAIFLVRHLFTPVTGANFTNTDGANPTVGLLLAGNLLYGTAAGGGSFGQGTLFDFSPTPVPVVITTTSLPAATVNESYTPYGGDGWQLLASGGQPPFTWTNIAGTLPPGINVGADGLVGGIPPTIGTYYFTVEATDALGVTATQALSLLVTNADTLTLSITNVTPGMVYSNVSPQFEVEGTAIEAGPAAGYFLGVTGVFYSINNSAWIEAYTGTVPNFAGWLAYVNLAPGLNTIAAYAVDTAGSVSATNTVTLDYVIPPPLVDVPGTPVTTNWNSGVNPIQIDEGGGLGVQPLNLEISPNEFSFTALSGDVVFLLDATGGNNRTNWAAVVNFFNPSDPNGTLDMPATEYQTFYPASPGPNYFASFSLFPRVIYVPIAQTISVPGFQAILARYDELGPVDGIRSGQLAAFQIVADVQPSGFTATITSPPGGGSFVAGTGALPVTGVTTTTNGQAAVTNVYFQLNGGAWTSASTTNSWTNWFGNVTVAAGNNTISAYAVDQNGNVSATNSVTFDYLVETPADVSLTASAAPEPVAVGSNLVYSLTVSNAGPGAASGLVISNQLPAGVTFVSATGGYLPSGGVLAMNIGALNVGETNLYQITFRTTAAAQLTNLFQLSSFSETDPNPANNSATVVSTVTGGGVASADLSLSATASTNTVYIINSELGSNLVYTVTVSNAGPATASGVVISNQPPGNFVSATGGATPTNGVLLLNLGSLAVGATNSAQIVVNLIVAGNYTNVFQVSANQFDPNLTNNSATVVTDVIGTNSTLETSSAGEYDTTNATTVSQQVTNYSTELIAKLPNGTVVFDQTYNAAYSDPTVQAAITTAAGDLTGAGDPSYTGPAQTSFLKTTNNSSVTVPTSTNANYIIGSKVYIGPQTILIGSFGQIQGYTFDPVVTNYFIPTSWNGSPTSFSLAPGESDIDTRVLALVNFFMTTTNTSIYTNSSVYVMTGIVAQADLSLSASAIGSNNGLSNLVYSITVSNAGPSTATGVVVSNQLPNSVNFVSVTGGSLPTNGVLLVNLGSLASGATNSVQIVVQPTLTGKLTNVFQVFANEFDPNLTNNSATVVSTVTNIGGTVTDTSTAVTYATILSSNVNQQVTNYSTELIAKLPNGTVVFDQTFNAAYSNPTVQAAITTAAVDLTNAGAASYTGPTETNASQTLAGSSSVTVTNDGANNFSFVTTTYIGPQTIQTGQLGAYQRTNTNVSYTGPTGGNPQSFVIPPGDLDFDTLETDVMTNLVTTTVTDTNLNSSVYVMTGIVAQVDVALSLVGAPNPVAVGAPLTYSLTVTNNSSTTATGVVVTNTLPPNVTLFSLLPSEGSASNNAGVVTFAVGSLPNGIAATLAIVVIPEVAGLLTNVAVAFSAQPDSQPTNNSVTNVTTAVNVPITNLVLTVLSPITLNPQTGLFEQTVEVSNGGPSTPSSVMVLVSGLAANATLYNATGITNGTPFVQSAAPLGVGSNVIFLLEFYVPTRVAPANLTYTVEAGPPMIPPVASGTILNISRTIVLANGSVLVEFSTVPGQVYAIQYSSDMVTWLTAVPAITAPANKVQWIDSGPPKTVSNPAQQPVRYYRVILLTAK